MEQDAPADPNAEVQMELFENIAWLFERNLYHYMSERQTQRFPFIEDLELDAPLVLRRPRRLSSPPAHRP